MDIFQEHLEYFKSVGFNHIYDIDSIDILEKPYGDYIMQLTLESNDSKNLIFLSIYKKIFDETIIEIYTYAIQKPKDVTTTRSMLEYIATTIEDLENYLEANFS